MNYNSLKATINANIKTNGNEEITGQVLNSVLTAMVDTIGAGYLYMGVATTETNPGTPDARVFYLAGMGTYTNFNAVIQSGSIGVFRYDTEWHTDTIEFPIGDDTMAEIVDDVIAELEGGDGYIVESDYPKTGLIDSAHVWKAVSQTDSILIPLRDGVTYTLTFANGLGGYVVVLDSRAVANAAVNYAPGYSGIINTTRGQEVTIQGVSGQYLNVRADPVSGGRVFPIISTHSQDSVFVKRTEVEEEPTEGSNGVVSSGGLYTLFSAINGLLSEIRAVLPEGRSYPPGRQDVPVSGVSFYNRVPGGSTNTARALSSTIPIPTGASGMHLTMASGFLGQIYYLRSDGSWDADVDKSGSFATDSYCAVPTSYNSAGVWIYIKKEDDSAITATEARNAITALYYDVPDTYLLPVASKELAQKEISVLFIGNSLTQDAVSYVPWLIRNLYPDLSFKFYMWYNGGYTLGQQYTKFVNDGTCEIFSICENSHSWRNYNNSVKMSDILTSYRFDIVCLQEYFNYKTTFLEADLVDFNNCVSYIRSNYGHHFKVATLFHAPLRASADSVFALTRHGNELILKKTSAQTMVSPGIAIYRALSTSLDSLGDRGHLSPDGTHAQEGLPCLLQAWVVFLWVMRQLSIPISIENCQLKMTTATYNTINVPGANLGTGVIEGTQAENWLAQDVAILGDKEGIGIEQNSFITMYE